MMVSLQTHMGQSREAGFSLTELLVSLTILSLIAVLLGAGMSFGLTSWHRTANTSEHLNETRLVRAYLADQLGRTLPLKQSENAGSDLVRFDGKGDEVRFIGVLAERFGGRPLHMTLRTSRDRSLVLEWCPLMNPVRGPCDEPRITTLLDNITDLRISYFRDERGIWEDRWIRESEMPSHLRISMESTDGMRFSDLIVPLRIDVDPTCIYDPVSGQCRGR